MGSSLLTQPINHLSTGSPARRLSRPRSISRHDSKYCPARCISTPLVAIRIGDVVLTPHRRHVGNALKSLPPTTDIPWQRVISSKGLISPRGDQGQGVARQKDRLEQEGVEVQTLAGAGGERVDLRRWGWFPEEIPEAVT